MNFITSSDYLPVSTHQTTAMVKTLDLLIVTCLTVKWTAKYFTFLWLTVDFEMNGFTNIACSFSIISGVAVAVNSMNGTFKYSCFNVLTFL